MPGRLRTSFRSGNLAEHLGLLFLKVSPLSRMCQEPKMLALMPSLLFFVAPLTETATPKTGSLYNSIRIRSL